MDFSSNITKSGNVQNNTDRTSSVISFDKLQHIHDFYYFLCEYIDIAGTHMYSMVFEGGLKLEIIKDVIEVFKKNSSMFSKK
jgi:hypothetical protein